MIFGLQNANGPSAEALLIFHDLVMVLVLIVASSILVFLFSYSRSALSYRFFTEHQTLEFV